MKKLAFAVGILIVALAAGVVLVLLPGKPQTAATPDPHADLIVVDSPKSGDAVSSIITITGKARGSWYFEASFPVELRDASGAVLTQGHAEAQSDWMTGEFVPFSATLILTEPPTPGSSGALVLKKDNPSGDPARDDSITIPVVFK